MYIKCFDFLLFRLSIFIHFILIQIYTFRTFVLSTSLKSAIYKSQSFTDIYPNNRTKTHKSSISLRSLIRTLVNTRLPMRHTSR
jgi:hypothetical protein